jgi:hypothetical protein
MSDLPNNFDSLPAASIGDAQPKLSPHWGRGAVAGLLSLFLPGMGQRFNRQPRKALVIAIITQIIGALVAISALAPSPAHTMHESGFHAY